jgi:cbb3-type cytochrome oxidase subunit 3
MLMKKEMEYYEYTKIIFVVLIALLIFLLGWILFLFSKIRKSNRTKDDTDQSSNI